MDKDHPIPASTARDLREGFKRDAGEDHRSDPQIFTTFDHHNLPSWFVLKTEFLDPERLKDCQQSQLETQTGSEAMCRANVPWETL